MKQEIDLLWTEMSYERSTKPNGKPTSNVQGGLITVGFVTSDKTDRILRWMTKESTDETYNDIDKMEKGKVCFYGNGFDFPPTRTYEFNDAFLVHYKQILDSTSGQPMQTTITISPAIQNYGADLIKPWNISYVPPREEEPYQGQEEEEENQKEGEVVDFYITDMDGNRITQYKAGDTIVINIESTDKEGDVVDIVLTNKTNDFNYNGEVLTDDKLPNYEIKGTHDKIELEVIRG